MISKKEKKVIIISIISLIIVAIIAILSVILIRKHTKNKTNNLISNNVNQINSNSSNLAIFNGDISTNYNGTYKFNTIKEIEFSDKLTKQEIQALYKNKNIKDKNELLALLKKEKDDATKNGELLVLYNGCINKTYGTEKERIPIPNSAGIYVGDDNLSRVTITSSNEIFYISLNHSSKNTALNLSHEPTSNGTKLYIFKQICSKYNPNLVLINVTYEYDLHIIEEEIDEEIYDF